MLREQTDGLGVDVAIECSGHPSGFTTCVDARSAAAARSRRSGLFVGEATVEPMLWALNDLTIVGTWCYWVYDFDRGSPRRSSTGRPAGRAGHHRAASRSTSAPDAFARLASGERGRDQGPRSNQIETEETPMKALVFEAAATRRSRDIDIPRSAADDVLVRSRNVGICHSDFELYEGRYIIPVSYPIIPGHEWCGRGRRGRERRSRALAGRSRRRRVRRRQRRRPLRLLDRAAPTPSTSRRKASWLHRIPEELSFTQGAFVEPFSVAYNATVAADGIDASDAVAVVGGGPIGLLCVMAAATMGGSVTIDRAAGASPRARRSSSARAARSIRPRADFAEQVAEATQRTRVRRRDRGGRRPRPRWRARFAIAAPRRARRLRRDRHRREGAGRRSGCPVEGAPGSAGSSARPVCGRARSGSWRASGVDPTPLVTATFPLGRRARPRSTPPVTRAATSRSRSSD